jgi:phosphoglycerol transferase MdoB-like AlkP superfamily enzyme
MKKRFLYLLSLFILILAIFAFQKPVFMLYNQSLTQGFSPGDYLAVMLYGLKLDSSMAGYIVLLPLVGIMLSIWWRKMNVRKIFLTYYLILSILISLVFIVDMALYRFWDFKLDMTILFYLDSPSNAMASVSFPFIAFRALFILLLSVLYFWLFMKITPTVLPPVKWKITGTIGTILLGGIFFLFIRGGITESTSNVGRVYFSENQFLNHSAVNPAFSFLYSLGKTEDFSSQFDFFPEEKRQEIFQGLYPKGGETITQLLNTDRPDILIILLESFSGNLVEALGGEPGVTPNLNRLSEEGIFFTNFYSNSFRTDRGMVCAFSGYPGFPTTSVMKIPVKSQALPSIAKSLLKAGYKTDFLYGGDIDFTNMQSYLRSTGYQKIKSDKDFSLKEQHTHAWGVTDGVTFEYLYDAILKRKDSPWHTGFLTLSSHDPFEVPYNRLENKLLNAFAYTDDCLGAFIDKLKKTPAWDNLLIICLADHGQRYPQNVTFQNPDFFHTPMLWLGGAVERPVKITRITNQTDLAATLLGQLKLPNDEFEFSRDVFGTSYTYPFSFSTFNNGFVFRDSTGVSVYDNNQDKLILEEPSPDAGRLEKAKAILQTIYDDLGKK